MSELGACPFGVVPTSDGGALVTVTGTDGETRVVADCEDSPTAAIIGIALHRLGLTSKDFDHLTPEYLIQAEMAKEESLS